MNTLRAECGAEPIKIIARFYGRPPPPGMELLAWTEEGVDGAERKTRCDGSGGARRALPEPFRRRGTLLKLERYSI